MKTYTASRLIPGNRIFPSSLIIDSSSITLKDPTLFGGKEKTIKFTKVASVNIVIPFIGFSTITIATVGEDSISLTGFMSDEVKEMKAKELAKILMETPDAEVVHYQYIGCETPLLKINSTTHEMVGQRSKSVDGGHFISENGIVESEIVILSYSPNQ